MTFSGPAPSAYTEQLLSRAEANLAARRAADAEQLVIAREWALAHAVTPADVARNGATHTRQIGAVHMRVWEYAAAELALTWHTHPLAAQKLMADALDLASRLPHAWDAVLSGQLPAWIARKLAAMTRDLAPDAARAVDEQLATDYPALSPGRLLSAAEGRVAAADPTLLDDRARQARKGHDVHVARPTDGTTTMFARLGSRDATRLDQACDTIADLLAEANGGQQQLTRGQLRAHALGLLADPEAAMDFLRGTDPRRGKAVVYVHFTPDLLCGQSDVARVEDLGPHTKKMLRDLLGHDHITLRPVIDLNDNPASDCYEVPARIAERVHLTKPADVFPWAESTSRRVDLDHTEPWPVGRTKIPNLGKLTRRHHRIKTHARGWTVQQLPGNRYLWRSPHGRLALVDRHGTHPADGLLLSADYPRSAAA